MYRDSEIGVVFHHGVLARSAFALRVVQLLTLVFSLVYAFIAVRFVCEYVKAPSIPFVEWIHDCTEPVLFPLRAFIHDGHDRAGHPIVWALVVAFGITVVVQTMVVSSLRRLVRPRLEAD